jgi:thiamine kinase-like enzyme
MRNIQRIGYIIEKRKRVRRKIMGIQNSNLEEHIIRKLLKENYKIDVYRIKKINRGTANIVEVESKEKKYILKEFSEGRTEESVIKETSIINFLKDKNIKVPIYIKSTQDNFYIKFENRIIILQEYVDGYTMENNTGDYSKTIESAKILGKITKELQNYIGLEEDGIIEKWFSKESLENGITKMLDLKSKLNENNPYKSIFEKDLEDKINMSKDLKENFQFDRIKKMTIMNSHGDYSVQQLIYNDQGETTVIDFETAKKLPIIWEVIRSYSYIDKEAKNGELNIDTLVDYVKEFSKYVKLNEYDLKYVAQIYLIQIVSSTFGYKQYNDNYEKTGLLEFALFRTNLCRYLYKHTEEISSRLQKEIKK